MTPVVIEKEMGVVEKALTIFNEVVELTSDLEIIGTNKTDTAFVIRNYKLVKGLEGAFVEIDIRELINKVKDSAIMSAEEQAQQIVDVIKTNRNDIILEGVTRIVGYYSRVNNWNKSKIGELRDRAKGEYWSFGNSKPNQESRLDTIDKL